MDNISDIISSLTDDDIENLKAAAANLFGEKQDAKPKTKSEKSAGGMPDLSSLLGNAQMMAKLSQIMSMMNRQDSRAELINALKPLLSEKRRKRADEAMQLLKLFDMLPMLTDLMGGERNGG